MVEALSWAAYLEKHMIVYGRDRDVNTQVNSMRQLLQVNILEGKPTKLPVQETQLWRQSLV